MENKQTLIFLMANFLLVVAAIAFIILPKVRDINHLRSHILWQERQYSARARDLMAHENNLFELETLNTSRRLLNSDEIIPAFSYIQQVMEQNSLRGINFTAGEHSGFYVHALGHITEHRVRAEYEVADAHMFLYALENTYANILTTEIIWDGNLRARIAVDMMLLSVGN